MKKNLSIQLKAAFLLIAFSLNIIVGFACAVGIDMGFNSHHHDEEEGIASSSSHHHDEADMHHHDSKNGKDNCCNEKVTGFAQLDKAVPQSINSINPLFFTSYFSAFYNIDVLITSPSSSNTRYFVRSYHPPIPNIRIAIQSFQI